MRFLESERFDRLALWMMVIVVMMALGSLTPSAIRTLTRPAPPPPPPPAEPPPPAVILPDELFRDLRGVFILVSDDGTRLSIGTAFLIDSEGRLLTAAHLVADSKALRLIDNSGGSHTVRMVGIDPAAGVAEVRSDALDLPLRLADTVGLQPGDGLAVLASPKNGLLALSTAAVISEVNARTTSQGTRFEDLLRLTADLQPGLAGSPVVGVGGTVVGILGLPGTAGAPDAFAVRIDKAKADIQAWRHSPETDLPMAAFPDNLILRGTGWTGSVAGSVTVTVGTIEPNRGSRGQETAAILHGSGFIMGPSLRVRFIPLAGQKGAFDATRVVVTDSGTIALAVPAGQVVADYRVQLTNCDGSLADSTLGFSVVQ